MSARADRIWNGRETALLAVLAAIGASCAPFLSPSEILDQSRYWIEIGIMALPMLLLIVARGIDLSVGSTLALCGVTIVRLHAEAGWPIGWAAAFGLALGAALGAVNGVLAALVRIPDLIVTLATMVIYRGLAQAVSQNRVYSNLPADYRWLGEGMLFGVVPVQWIAMLLFWAAAAALLHGTTAGRYAFAIGSSPAAARCAALPVRAVRIGLYALSGFAAALAAVVYTARNNTARSDDGAGFELGIIACVFLGGASFRGGSGSAVGCMLAVLILGLGRTGMELAGVGDLVQQVATGVVLIVTAAFNSRSRAAPR